MVKPLAKRIARISGTQNMEHITCVPYANRNQNFPFWAVSVKHVRLFVTFFHDRLLGFCHAPFGAYDAGVPVLLAV